MQGAVLTNGSSSAHGATSLSKGQHSNFTTSRAPPASSVQQQSSASAHRGFVSANEYAYDGSNAGMSHGNNVLTSRKNQGNKRTAANSPRNNIVTACFEEMRTLRDQVSIFLCLCLY